MFLRHRMQLVRWRRRFSFVHSRLEDLLHYHRRSREGADEPHQFLGWLQDSGLLFIFLSFLEVSTLIRWSVDVSDNNEKLGFLKIQLASLMKIIETF